LYVEDTPSNVVALRAQRNPTIIFTNSTNRDLPGARAENWDDVERLVAEQVALSRDYLASAVGS
jgi:hypothetical protein